MTRAVQDRLAAHRAIAGQLIALSHLLRRPVVNDVGTRMGRVSDVVVRWVDTGTYPRVTGVLVSVGRGYALVDAKDITLNQTLVELRTSQVAVARPVRGPGDVALARDVLDHQLVDLAGIQVVRAADVYLLNRSGGWELVAVDVGVRAFLRRLVSRRRRCPPPARAIDWADLQSFVPRFADEALPRGSEPAAAAGAIGGAVQLGVPAKELQKLRAKDVARILDELGRGERAQVSAMAAPSAAAQALRQLDPAQRDALLAELGEPDRHRLQQLLDESPAPP